MTMSLSLLTGTAVESPKLSQAIVKVMASVAEVAEQRVAHDCGCLAFGWGARKKFGAEK